MTGISAALVKELRERTGAGMMDCKKALAASEGDLEQAIEWLRAKGLSAAAKKAGRIAAEGLVAAAVGDCRGALVEVNSETDFVARNQTFQSVVAQIAGVALAHDGDFGSSAAAAFPGGGHSVAEHLTELVGTIGEKLEFRRSEGIAVQQGLVASYVHSAVAPGMGKIAVLVGVESTAPVGRLAELGKQLAMQVAAASPLSVTVEDLDPAVVEREKRIFSEQARESGKPDAIAAKIAEGRLRKFYGEAVLLEQAFVMDAERQVQAVVEEAAQAAGTPIRVAGFSRFALGEGIEKPTADFAAEVASVVGA